VEHTVANAPKLHFTFPVPSISRYLIVACGDLHLALPEAVIRRVLSAEEVVDRPADPAPERSSITALAARFEQPAPPETAETRVIEVGRSAAQQAFLVEKVLGFADLRSDLRRPLPRHFRAAERRWFAGLFLFRDTIALILNPQWLLEEESDGEDDCRSDGTGTELFKMELELAADGDDAPWADV
jgi:hypothetical protein